MGLPANCMHFVGSPGWRGNSNSPASTNSLTIPCTPLSQRQRKSAERSAPHLYVLCARVFRVLMRCFERSHAFRLLTAILRDRLRCRRHTMTREIAVFRVLTGHFTISMRRRARFRASLLFTLNWKGTSAYTFLCPVAVWGILPSLNSGASGSRGRLILSEPPMMVIFATMSPFLR